MPLNITLTDYGVGNLYSIRRSLENCGAEVTVVTDMKDVLDAECIVFPGVGAFDRTMEKLQPYREDIREKLASGTPALGICIGMQILFGSSAEGTTPGLGFFDGKVPVIEDARSMEEAVSKAYKQAEKGDTVLLSPCCASFDLFKSYEDRGDQFKACVRNL